MAWRGKPDMRSNQYLLLMYRFFTIHFILMLIFAGNASAELSGIYSLWSPDKVFTSTPDLNKDFVAGGSIRATWAVVEPNSGVYNWGIIDSSINQVQASGKQVILRVLGSNRSPDWVMASSQVISNNMSLPYMPLPWDPFYLSSWQNFITQLGNKYRDNPAIVLVEMAGGGKAGEMILDSSYGWIAHGYTSDIMIATWKSIIDSYVLNFPNKLLALDINKPIPSDSTTLSAIINYCLTQYPGRIVFQYNGLNGMSINPGFYDKILLECSESTIVGYQTVGSLNFNEELVGDYQTMFQKALNSGASYFEIYRYDVLAPQLQGNLEWLNVQIEARAGGAPLPGTIVLLGSGLLGLGLGLWGRRLRES